MDDVFVYCVTLPAGVKEMVTPCNTGYTIYINESLAVAEQHRSYAHALEHIRNNDFEKSDADEAEYAAHLGQSNVYNKLSK